MKQEKQYNIPNCIVREGSHDLYKSLWKEEAYYLIRFLLSYFGAKEVQFRVPRDII